MLAKPEEGGVPAPAPTPAKRRTISLTSRAPIEIIEDEWPEIAVGIYGDDAGEHLEITVRVRRCRRQSWRYIVYATYWYDTLADEGPETARCGRYLPCIAVDEEPKLWEAIRETGDELRERIMSKGGSHPNAGVDMRQFVVYAVDRCFEKLTPIALKG